MANEAVAIQIPTSVNPVRRTVSNGQAIEKYTLLQLIDPNTVAPSSGAVGTCPFGGIAAMEKVASDNSTTISCYMEGVFDLYAGGGTTIPVGQAVSISGANTVELAGATDVENGEFVGYAEEAVAIGTAETIRVRLRGGFS